MVCIQCGSETRVINSRHQKRTNRVWRRRQCLNCKNVFTTEESAQYAAAWLVKAKSGALQPFSRDKLFLSVIDSLKHRKTALVDAEALAETIISKLVSSASNGTIDSQSISQITLVALNRFDKAASVRYQAIHQ